MRIGINLSIIVSTICLLVTNCELAEAEGIGITKNIDTLTAEFKNNLGKMFSMSYPVATGISKSSNDFWTEKSIEDIKITNIKYHPSALSTESRFICSPPMGELRIIGNGSYSIEVRISFKWRVNYMHLPFMFGEGNGGYELDGLSGIQVFDMNKTTVRSSMLLDLALVYTEYTGIGGTYTGLTQQLDLLVEESKGEITQFMIRDVGKIDVLTLSPWFTDIREFRNGGEFIGDMVIQNEGVQSLVVYTSRILLTYLTTVSMVPIPPPQSTISPDGILGLVAQSEAETEAEDICVQFPLPLLENISESLNKEGLLDLVVNNLNSQAYFGQPLEVHLLAPFYPFLSDNYPQNQPLIIQCHPSLLGPLLLNASSNTYNMNQTLHCQYLIQGHVVLTNIWNITLAFDLHIYANVILTPMHAPYVLSFLSDPQLQKDQIEDYRRFMDEMWVQFSHLQFFAGDIHIPYDNSTYIPAKDYLLQDTYIQKCFNYIK